MTYIELNNLYKNNGFREIDKDLNSQKFYLLRSISKKHTLRKFCNEYGLNENLNEILSNVNITAEEILAFITKEFKLKTEEEISAIEEELNKMQNFDWGGSAGNNLEKNIVNNYIKKTLKYEDIEKALLGPIQRSVYGYTLNSWYNHWSSILIEEIFNSNKKIIPTLDLVEKIDFFISKTPFDLKVTYFPEELMKVKIGPFLKKEYDSASELTCCKKLSRELGIAIPNNLDDRALTICLEKLLEESTEDKAKDFLDKLANIKKNIYDYYITNPNELIVWLYENQGEMRFDAANRFYVVLIDTNNPFESWKLKRNVRLLKQKISEKIEQFNETNLNKISFYWNKDGRTYDCYSELLFIRK